MRVNEKRGCVSGRVGRERAERNVYAASVAHEDTIFARDVGELCGSLVLQGGGGGVVAHGDAQGFAKGAAIFVQLFGRFGTVGCERFFCGFDALVNEVFVVGDRAVGQAV